MSVTENFLKLRSSGAPRPGEWNVNYQQALALAKQNGKFIITFWSNGEVCSFCTKAEACMLQDVFKEWMKTSDAYFVFQYSGDADKGEALYDWIYKRTPLSIYPGFRITFYDRANPDKIAYDYAVEGNTLRGNKINLAGAKTMIDNLNQILSHMPARRSADSAVPADFKIRLNEKLTTKQVNKILDAIDANDGYCPCQAKSEGTKCHCVDFIERKKIGEPCICNIYVKQSRPAVPRRKRR